MFLSTTECYPTNQNTYQWKLTPKRLHRRDYFHLKNRDDTSFDVDNVQWFSVEDNNLMINNFSFTVLQVHWISEVNESWNSHYCNSIVIISANTLVLKVSIITENESHEFYMKQKIKSESVLISWKFCCIKHMHKILSFKKVSCHVLICSRWP